MDPAMLATAGRIAWAALTNRWVQLVLAAAACYAIGHHNGYQAKVKEDAAAVSKQQTKVAKIEHKDATINTTVNTDLAKAQAKTQDATNANLGKVRTYVTPKADAGCIVTTGAVRLLNAAGRDVPVDAPAPGELQEAPSGVALSDIVGDDIVNAGSYHQALEDLAAWDRWYDEHAANWGQKPSAPNDPVPGMASSAPGPGVAPDPGDGR